MPASSEISAFLLEMGGGVYKPSYVRAACSMTSLYRKDVQEFHLGMSVSGAFSGFVAFKCHLKVVFMRRLRHLIIGWCTYTGTPCALSLFLCLRTQYAWVEMQQCFHVGLIAPGRLCDDN